MVMKLTPDQKRRLTQLTRKEQKRLAKNEAQRRRYAAKKRAKVSGNDDLQEVAALQVDSLGSIMTTVMVPKSRLRLLELQLCLWLLRLTIPQTLLH